ncbi:MAG TPA: septal ring lytic transglycosylase RlpA family protein [Stellaceae bacterium]|jgi:rare lipoprotein A|nr:septal ring lytic transglycosylase RlpA family protein [Stellaceae bacterium]
MRFVVTRLGAMLLAFLSLGAAPCLAARTIREVGVASWYGPGFQGRRTASGARFNMKALTAASRRLPLDHWAKVTDLKTGRSAWVWVNDRGPYVPGRIIDLSKAAATHLGYRRQGLAEVVVKCPLVG